MSFELFVYMYLWSLRWDSGYWWDRDEPWRHGWDGLAGWGMKWIGQFGLD